MYYPLAWYKGPDKSIDPFEENRQKQVVGLMTVYALGVALGDDVRRKGSPEAGADGPVPAVAGPNTPRAARG